MTNFKSTPESDFKLNGSIRSKDAVPYSVAKTERVSVRPFYAPDNALNSPSSSSQQSIQKVVGYALKYFPRCGEDLWDCIVEECQKVSVCFI